MTKTMDEIGRLFGEGAVAGLSDGQLVERFACRRDGEAFEAIVARHGPMVLAACRSSLGRRDQAEADDAFQATFLILARRAGTFPLHHGSLAGWLYRAARRVARQSRLEASRRRAREQVAAGRGRPDSSHDPALEEVRDLIRQEVARLPERYRVPIVLCDLHGLTRDEAAEAIGCPPGTVAGRLARARERPRSRLARRGVTSASAWPTSLGLAKVDRSSSFRSAARLAVASARGDAVGASVAAARLVSRASSGWFGWPLPGTLGPIAALAASCIAAAVLALAAAGGLVAPMQPWAAVTGRIVDEQGRPMAFDGPAYGHPGPIFLGSEAKSELAAHDDPKIGILQPAGAGVDGRIRIEQLVPGQVYTAIDSLGVGQPGGTLLDRAKFAPGEVRDLGDIRARRKPEAAGGPDAVVYPPGP